MSVNRIYKETDGGVSLWDLPIFGDNGEIIENSRLPALNMPTAEDIEKIQRQAHDEAYKEAYEKSYQEGLAKGHEEGLKSGHAEGVAQGYNEGIAQGQALIQQKAGQLDQVLNSFSQPLLQLDQEVEEQLVALSISIAKHLIRRELRTDPGQIIGVVRQTVSVLPIAARDVRVVLHPEDAALVREALSVKEGGSEDERRWRIIEDPVVTRGGCTVETEHSRIDASVETRIAAIVAQTLGGERGGDKA